MGSWMSNMSEKLNDTIDGCVLPISEDKTYALLTEQIKFCFICFYKEEIEI